MINKIKSAQIILSKVWNMEKQRKIEKERKKLLIIKEIHN
jgi:hypothetical protein